eukprot:4628910-Pyramimonas_sp.AAC.1
MVILLDVLETLERLRKSGHARVGRLAGELLLLPVVVQLGNSHEAGMNLAGVVSDLACAGRSE